MTIFCLYIYHKITLNYFLYLEYIIEDPTLLKQIQPSIDSTSSTTGSDDDQHSSKNKFAQIKAKFEQKNSTNVMASPSSSSSVTSSNATAVTSRNSFKQVDSLYRSNRRPSTDSLSVSRTYNDAPNAPSTPSNTIQNNSNHRYSQYASQSSLRRLNSADEADEEVQRIHRQSEGLRHRHDPSPSLSSFNQTKQQSNVQYEVIDEDGNPMAVDDVHDLIKKSGVTAREVKQPNGSVLREYVIDDPELLSKFRPQQSPLVPPQPRVSHDNIPPPPPRIPLKQSILLRPESSNTNQNTPMNIQQIRVLEPQRRYEYITTSGKHIEFMITNLGSDNQTANDSDIQELANAINTRLLPPSNNIQQQQPFTLPKPWHPAVDLTHREPPTRQRTGSDDQPNRNKQNTAFQQVQPTQADLVRSASYGALNPGSYQQTFAPVFTEPIIDWSALQQQDPHGQIDPQLVRQFITQKHQSGSFQTPAQFLPEQQQQQQQVIKSRTASPQNIAPVFYQQPMSYSYPGQQHGVTVVNADNNGLNQHQPQVTQVNTTSPPNNATMFYQQPTAYPYPGQQQQYGVTILNTNTNDLNQQQQQMTRSRASSPQNNAPAFYQQPMSYSYQGQQQNGVTILNTNNNDLNRQQQQMTRSRATPPQNNPHFFYQQPMSYPYQGQQQQQHGVRILNNDNNDLNQQQKQSTMIGNGHSRI